MSNYNTLKTTIDANIKQNGNQEITGQILNSVLNAMVTTLGTGYQFAGVATIATNPGTPDAKVFYIANGKGTYEKFGGLEVTEDDVVVLYYDTAWHKVSTGIASQAKLSELEEKVANAVSITYAELKSLRDAGKLVPGTQYRITDYTCTTTQVDTQSAGHVFDIIVTADSMNKLNENASAIQHTDDTYFANSKLESWELKYCLDNDTARFAWADTVNGKGVIYWMKDEYDNECPYDFKNIQFKRYAVTNVTSTNLTSDALNELKNTFVYKENGQPIHFSFSSSNITNNGSTLVIDNNNYGWYYTFSTIKYDNGYPSVIEDASVIGVNFYNDEGGGGCFKNKIEVYRNFMASDNGGLDGCCILNNIVFNGRYEQDGYVYNAYSNHIKSQSYSNTFGNNCWKNTFGNNCFSNTFGDHCYNNTFGNDCGRNTFGNYCYGNTFGNSFQVNTFGNDCWGNTFGNDCYKNTFGNYFQHNTFGNSCGSNTFGNDCQSNTFGNSCIYIKFASDASATTKYNYYQNNYFGDGCQYIVLTGAETASSSAQVQNYNFAQGLKGTSSAYLTIDGKRNLAYETKVAKNSNGEIKTYCEADLIL